MDAWWADGVVRMEHIDDAVLGTLGGDVLRPTIVEAVFEGVQKALKPSTITKETAKRRDEIAKLETEIRRLTEAIATSSGAVPTLLEALQTRQQRRDELVATLAIVTPTAKRIDVRGIETAVREKLTAWRSLLTRQTQDGRELLRQVLVGPLRFMPEGKTYHFDGTAALGRLLAGVVPTNLASLKGLAPFSANGSVLLRAA